MAWSECMQIVLNPSETNFETESDQWRWIGIQMYNWKWVGRWNKVDEMCIFREKERKKERKRLQRKTLLLLLLLLLVLGTSAISWWRQLIGALRGVFQAAAPSTGTVGAECRAHTGVATHRSRTFARFPTFYPPLFPQSLSAGLFLFSLPRMGWQCHVAAGNRGFHHTLSIALASGFFFFFFFFFFSHFFWGTFFECSIFARWICAFNEWVCWSCRDVSDVACHIFDSLAIALNYVECALSHWQTTIAVAERRHHHHCYHRHHHHRGNFHPISFKLDQKFQPKNHYGREYGHEEQRPGGSQ